MSDPTTEFARILKPTGGIALAWNRRDDHGSAFLSRHETMLHECIPEYSAVNHKSLSDEQIGAWFGTDFEKREFANLQIFDLDGLRGRLQSSSYCPLPGSPAFDSVMNTLAALFDEFADNGAVEFHYRTQVYASGTSS